MAPDGARGYHRGMMGNRGKTNADEWDAFSRRSRRLLHWKPGELRQIKRLFARKQRLRAERQIKNEVRADA